ncbi:alpha/beta-hydrolase [Schizophyllum commune H4-8]|uniref:alpha/beta-hydrolase n=1 Tax=Schizophyllum commune (strain H4-8 / FGSC 9210) TaxID=578458 RepID=UPI00215EE3E9|nr:alpha/beta-hydrolase [Schizophyllum commune H4-8]KAI5899047.1 alpha/beta-hydrolase [Schizophyllum commune H4-8]
MLTFTAFGALLASNLVIVDLSGRDATPLSLDAIESYMPYAQLARAAYCVGNSTTWDYGDACAANDDFELYGSGGDGTANSPYYFVGYSPSLSTIIVAHGGIEAEELFSTLQSAEAAQAPVNVSLFLGVDDDVQVQEGFSDAHAKTAEAVLAAVHDTISGTGAAVLTTVGHGLGGALAEIDAVYLRLNVPFIRMNTITFGKPRVGNGAWADLVDANVSELFDLFEDARGDERGLCCREIDLYEFTA